MKQRSPEATVDEILEWFYQHPVGVAAIHTYKIVPGRRLAPGILEELINAGRLVAVWPEGSPEYDDPWSCLYRISYDEWITRASRDQLADRQSDP